MAEKRKSQAEETRREAEATRQSAERAAGSVERSSTRMVSSVASAARRALESVERFASRVSGEVQRGATRAATAVQGAAQRAAAAAQQAADRSADAMRRGAQHGAQAVETAYAAAYRKVDAAAARAASRVPRGTAGSAARGGGGGGGDEGGGGGGGGLLGMVGKVRGHPVAQAALTGLKVVKDFGVAAVQAAMKSQAAWSKLGQTMKKAGVDLADKQDELNTRAKEFTRNTTFSRDEYVGALTRMIDITGDYDSSVRNMALAADVAAKRNIDLSSAAELVGKVAQGDAEALAQLGVSSGSAQEGLAKLSEECGGFAKNQASTLDGKVKQLNNAWGDFKTAVGNAMIEAGGGTSIMDTLRGVVVTVTDAFVQNKAQIVAWAQVGIAIVGALATTIWSVIRLQLNLAQATGDMVRVAMYGLEGLVLGAVNKVIQGINWGIEKLNSLPGVKISLLDTLDERLKRTRANLSDAAADLRGQFGDIKATAGDFTASWSNVGNKISIALNTRSGSAPPAPRSFPSTPKVAPPKKGGARTKGRAKPGDGDRGEREAHQPAPAEPCECDAGDTTRVENNVQVQQNKVQENNTQENNVQEKNLQVVINTAEATGELAEEQEKLIAAQEQELELLERASKFAEERADGIERARKLEEQLNETLKDQKLDPKNRVSTCERLSRVTELRKELEKPEEKPKRAKVEDFSLEKLGKNAKGAKKILLDIEKGADKTGAKIGDSMANAFGKMITGAASVGEILDGLWKSMAKGALEAIAAKAKGRAGESAAEAIEETALGIGAAASGNGAAAAGHFASAGKHLAAATAWSALAGGMAAAAGAVGGGGGGSTTGTPQSSRDAGSAVAERAERRGPEIHIYVDGIDPTNPRHQKLTHETMKGIRERYGSDGTVTYAPRRTA